MAIPFARQEFVQRSKGRNAIQKSAYISRERLEFEGNCVLAPETYDYSYHKAPAYSAVFLPEGVDEKFKDPQVLWNAAEKAETRKNSVVQTDNVVALPDEEEVTLEMKIKIAKAIAKECFTDHGLGVQAAIHFPTKHAKGEGISGTIVETRDGEYGIQINGKGRVIPLTEEELKKYDISESNWHLHLLGTTRRFSENGKELGEKARDIMPQIRNNRIISGCNLLSQCVDITNRVLKEENLSLRVELSSLVPQKHLGPVRMRGNCTELMEVQEERKELNAELAKNPENILIALSEKQSLFTEEDVERYISKHTPQSHIEYVRENFWKLPDVIQLRDKKSHQHLALFSSRETIEEERKIMRIAERVNKKPSLEVFDSSAEKFSKELNGEQKRAYFSILKGKGISVLHGYAGTGKSYVLKALDSAYRESEITVRALGADNSAAAAMREKGIEGVQNIHQFLFGVNRYKTLTPEKNEVWILDEAGKIGNELLLEFLKTAQKYKATLVFSGDPAQLPSITRGGMFHVFSKEFLSAELLQIQRQKEGEDLEIVKAFAMGETYRALDLMHQKGNIKWSETKAQAVELLAKDWALVNKPMKGECPRPEESIIITGTNAEMRVLNSVIRETRKSWGVLGKDSITCQTGYGTFEMSQNDLIQFRGNSKKIGVTNGMRGKVLEVDAVSQKVSVEVKGTGKTTRLVTFHLKDYKNFQLGYATNTDLSQGGTWNHVFVLDSPRSNRETSYVNFSRHVESCRYYVAQTETSCLAELKMRSNLSGEKLTSFGYTHTAEIEKAKAQEARDLKLERLKENEALKTRLKGHFLSFRDTIKGKIEERLSKTIDLQQKEEVYDYKNRQIFKAAPSLDVNAVSSALSTLGSLKPFLEENLLKEINEPALDYFYDRFFNVSEEAAKLRFQVETTSKKEGVLQNEVPIFGEMIQKYKEKYCIGKIFVEGAAYQKLSIAEEWGSDAQKSFKKGEQKFVDSHTHKDFFRKEEKTQLNKAWENCHFGSRALLNYSKAESLILKIREEDTDRFAKGRQRAFEGNWYAYASLLQREKKSQQEAITGIFKISEETEAKLHLKGLTALKSATESFLKSTTPVLSLFKESFKTEEESFKAAENSYRVCLNEIGVLRREIAWQATEKDQADFKKCPSYKDLEQQFKEREGYAIGFLAQIESRYHAPVDVLDERPASQIGYQTKRFEELFQLSNLQNSESIHALSEETLEAFRKYEEVSLLTLTLKRSCTIEALAQGKKIKETEDFELFCVAGEKRREVSEALYQEILKVGHEHFDMGAVKEVFVATLALQKQERLSNDGEKPTLLQNLWSQVDFGEKGQEQETETRVFLQKPLSKGGFNTLLFKECPASHNLREWGEYKKNFRTMGKSGQRLVQEDAYKILQKEPDKLGVLTEEGKKEFDLDIQEFKERTTPPEAFNKESQLNDGDGVMLAMRWKTYRKISLEVGREIALAETEKEKKELVWKRARLNRDRNASGALFLEYLRKESRTDILSELGAKEIEAQRSKHLQDLAEGKQEFSGNLFKEDIEISKEMQGLGAQFCLWSEKVTQAKKAFSQVDTSQKDRWNTLEGRVLVESLKKRNVFGKALALQTEEEKKAAKEVFSERGKEAVKGAEKKFDGKFLKKSPLIPKAKGASHPLIQEYVRLEGGIAKVMAQKSLLKETSHLFSPKDFHQKNYEEKRSLELQQGMMAKMLFEAKDLGEKKLKSLFQEKNFSKLCSQKNHVEQIREQGTQSTPSYGSPAFGFGSYHKPYTQEQEERHLFHKEKKWTSLVPDEEKYPSPSPRSNETVRHAYRNEEGKLLFYVVRIEEMVQGQKEKKTPPLSFGMEEGGRPKWKWKGFDFGEEKRTLYNLHLLKEHPKADVVIVEGEKAADAAAEKMQSLGRENMIAVSWIGGSKAVSKTDWTPLAGRNVLIWPDNDKAGFEAAKQIERELFRMYHMEKEIRTIDTQWLKKNFPKGWDLADPFPKGLKQNDLQEYAKGYAPSYFMGQFMVFSGNWSSSFAKRLQLADIGSAYLFGRGDAIEKEIGESSIYSQSKVLESRAFDLVEIFKKEEDLLQKFENDPILQVSQETKQHLARQSTLFEARNGREATLSEMQTMKSVIEEAQGQINSVLQKDKALEPLQECAKQRMLESFCTKALDRGSFSIPESKDLQKDFGREMQEIQKTQQREMEIEQQKQLEKSLNRGRGFGIGD